MICPSSRSPHSTSVEIAFATLWTHFVRSEMQWLTGRDATTTLSAFSPVIMTIDLPRFFSPKRKREPSESDCYSPSASPTSTISVASLQEARLREEVDLGRHSPRAAVAGRFRELAIRGDPSSEPAQLHRDLQPEHGPRPFQARCAFESLRDPEKMPEPLPVDSGELHGAEDNQPPPERHMQGTTGDTSTATTTSPSRRKATPPPSRKQRNSVSPSKSRKQRVSPPLADVSPEDPFTWHDHEITGHNPTDPTDDGYGINGVGFKPTAAIAWARSQRRRRQVAEWKSREAREAREKRRARRNEDVGLDNIHGIHEGAIQKRVKFDV